MVVCKTLDSPLQLVETEGKAVELPAGSLVYRGQDAPGTHKTHFVR